MKRLRELEGTDAESKEARALVRSFAPISAGAVPASRAEQRGAPRRGAMLRPIFVILLFLVAGLASAMAWRALRAPKFVTTKRPTSPAPCPSAPVDVAVPAPIDAPPPTVPAPVAPARPRPHAPRDTEARPEAPTTARTDDFALLVEATAALRSDHAPLRALALARRYVETYPDGTLAEEALALACEAAHVADDPSAEALAESYLARHPSGRFAARVRALASPSR